jgi:hypothetical protein
LVNAKNLDWSEFFNSRKVSFSFESTFLNDELLFTESPTSISLADMHNTFESTSSYRNIGIKSSPTLTRVLVMGEFIMAFILGYVMVTEVLPVIL